MNSFSTFETPSQLGLEKAGNFIQHFAAIDPFLPAAAIGIFLEIARETHVNGHTNSEKISKALNLRPSVVTKYTYYWSDQKDLVYVTVDPKDKRRRLITLTPDGEALVKKLGQIL